MISCYFLLCLILNYEKIWINDSLYMYFADYCLIGNSAVVEDIGVADERWLAEKGWRSGVPRSSESDDFLPAPDSFWNSCERYRLRQEIFFNFFLLLKSRESIESMRTSILIGALGLAQANCSPNLILDHPWMIGKSFWLKLQPKKSVPKGVKSHFTDIAKET